jgi:uncharacterized protein (DUF2147 family)
MVAKTRILNLLSVCTVFIILFVITGFETTVPAARRLVGVWESEEKNLRMEMFEENGHFAGKMIWFQCSSNAIMQNLRDTENPDDRLADRKLLGLKLVDKLSYQGDNVWGSGKIYDPNSGNTYEARIQLSGPNTAIVRGYWKYKWFGRSMVFNRL